MDSVDEKIAKQNVQPTEEKEVVENNENNKPTENATEPSEPIETAANTEADKLKAEIERLKTENQKLLTQNHELNQKITIFEELRNKKVARDEKEKQKNEKFKLSLIASCITIGVLLFLYIFRTEISTIFANINYNQTQVYHQNEPYYYDEDYDEDYYIEEETAAQQNEPEIITIIVYECEEPEYIPELDFYVLTAQLADFFAQFGDSVAVFYENLETGFTFSHGGDRVFFAASATKAPFALYIFQKAELGLTDLNSSYTFTEADFWEGTGTIRHMYDVGATFTQRQLLYLMVAPSDNIATRILRRAHGLAGYRDFIEEIGGDVDLVHNLTYSRLSANEAGIMLREMYRYINSGGTYSLEFKSDMQANRYQFITSTYPIASKSGWAGNFGGAWHDIAIVFAPSPYTLALLSTKEGTAADRRVYDTISQFIQDFNERWFVERVHVPSVADFSVVY